MGGTNSSVYRMYVYLCIYNSNTHNEFRNNNWHQFYVSNNNLLHAKGYILQQK